MDYASKGSLSDLIEKVSLPLFSSKYTDTNRQIILAGIARGMMILHRRHIIHRDLKPENVLLYGNFEPKITNFGIPTIFDSEDNWFMNANTIAYIAPEVIKSNAFSTKSDVYSFGILMYEILSDRRAYRELFESPEFTYSIFTEKVTSGLRPDINFPIKSGLKKMIESCLSENPNDRPTFCELFCKLSLQDEANFRYFDDENGPILNDSDYRRDRMKYCLDGVDLDALFKYVDEIMSDPQPPNQQDEIEKLKAKNKELAKTINEQRSRISYLVKHVSTMKNDYSRLVEDNKLMVNENTKLEEINRHLTVSTNSNQFKEARNEVLNDQVIIQNEINVKTNNNNSVTNHDQTNDQIIIQNEVNTQSANSNGLQLMNDGVCSETKEANSRPKERRIELQNGTADKNDDVKEATVYAEKFNQTFESPQTDTTKNEPKTPADQFQRVVEEARKGGLTKIDQPSPILAIPDYSFKCCNRLTEVTIPPTVTSIGSYSFIECTSLTKVEIPASVTSIGDYSFCLCSRLENLAIPDSVTSIGSHAFSRCSSFEMVEIPLSVTAIGASCFSWCTSLRRVRIPDSVKAIEDCTFFGCSSLTSVEIPPSVTSIGYDAFYKCSSLVDADIPDSVESIGKGGFNGCLSLKKIKVPSSLAIINEYTFFDCSSLESVEIPSSVKSIGSYAFGECCSLETVKIPSSVESIENNSFPNETKLIK